MRRSAFWDFLFLSLHRHRSRHASVLVMAVIIVSLLCSVLFLAGALSRDVKSTLDQQADLIVQKVRGGKVVDLPAAWAEDFSILPAVGAAVPRVFGRYYHEPNGRFFMVMGVDPFDEPTSEALEKLIEGLDLKAFLKGDQMVVGQGVADFLLENHYQDVYEFVSPMRQRIPVQVFARFPDSSDLFTNDLVVMDLDLARQVLGMNPELATDIVLQVPNANEGDAVMAKLIDQHYDIRVIQKKEIAVAFENLFQYRGGVFLLIYLVVSITFALILYQRYGLITGPERKQIGLMRAVGWGIGDVVTLKICENLVVALTAFMAGVIFSYLYVFFLDAPGLSAVFLGFSNLPVNFSLNRSLDFSLLALIFLLFVVPFLVAVLIPVWRVAITDPVEAMK